jgi:LacI family transcriptional regulator
MNKVTIDDIAKVAGVSKSTVSRVLHGKVAVHPDKKNAVLTATRRLGFKPNIVAQSLASGRSMTIGVLTQNMGSPFYDAIAQGVIAGLSNSNYSPIFADGQWQIPKELSALQSLVGRRVDGLVLIGGGISSQQLEDSCEGLPTELLKSRIIAASRWTMLAEVTQSRVICSTEAIAKSPSFVGYHTTPMQ